MSISSEKYYLWSPECSCDLAREGSAYGEKSLMGGKGRFCYSQELSVLPCAYFEQSLSR